MQMLCSMQQSRCSVQSTHKCDTALNDRVCCVSLYAVFIICMYRYSMFVLSLFFLFHSLRIPFISSPHQTHIPYKIMITWHDTYNREKKNHTENIIHALNFVSIWWIAAEIAFEVWTFTSFWTNGFRMENI